MGILDKNKKSSVKSAFTPATTSNMYKINGNKKASYCLAFDQDSENVDPKKKTSEKLVNQEVIYHENQAFEPDSGLANKSTNPFEVDTTYNNDQKETFLLCTQNQTTSISSMTSINNTEKLAAAAAAAVSSTAASVVEIPNFGEELTTMMQQNRMDEVEIGSKKGDTTITQTHGYTYGEGSNPNKTMKKSPSSNAIGDLAALDDDAKLKLTGPSSSYDIKIRQRRTCHLKVLVVLIALLTAGCIGCIFTYYFMRYQVQHQKYLSYTGNMVYERASKLGSNKLEILVPFETNVTNLNDKSVIVNKIEEIVLQTFVEMNKTVDVMQLYELTEISTNSYLAAVDVELRDASDFSNVVLIKENENRIKIDDRSDILKIYRDTFWNVTISSNFNPAILKINASQVDILYDFKRPEVKTEKTTRTHVSSSTTSSILKVIVQDSNLEVENSKIMGSESIVVEINKSSVNRATEPSKTSTTTESTSTIESKTSTLVVTTSVPVFEKFSTESIEIQKTTQETRTTGVILPKLTSGVSRILSTTINIQTTTLVQDFTPKNVDLESSAGEELTLNEDSQLKLLKNEETPATSSGISTTESSTSNPTEVDEPSKNKVLIAEIILNNEGESDPSPETVKIIEIEPEKELIKTIDITTTKRLDVTSVPVKEQSQNHDLDVVLQIDGSYSNLLNRFLEKLNRK